VVRVSGIDQGNTMAVAVMVAAVPAVTVGAVIDHGRVTAVAVGAALVPANTEGAVIDHGIVIAAAGASTAPSV